MRVDLRISRVSHSLYRGFAIKMIPLLERMNKIYFCTEIEIHKRKLQILEKIVTIV